MSAIAAIGAGIARGVGALARGVRNRKIRKSGATVSVPKTGFFSPERKAVRKERRATRRENKAAAGGGFIKKAVARHRAKKAAGQTRKQLRQARKGKPITGMEEQAISLLGYDTATGLPEYSDMAQFTGGEKPEPKEGTESPVMKFIEENWIIGVIIIGVVMLGKWLFSGNKRKK